jgi:hypothetical protein
MSRRQRRKWHLVLFDEARLAATSRHSTLRQAAGGVLGSHHTNQRGGSHETDASYTE